MASAIKTNSLRVLVVDDHPTIRRTVRILLGKLGHHVDVAEDGWVALEAACQGDYDVVLLDIRMPGMDGVEVVQQMRRRLPPESKTRVFAHTADTGSEEHAYFKAAGMDDVLLKPVRMADLETAFVRWFPRV